MIQTEFETRIKVQDIVSSQLPNFILDESPKTVDFLKQYYLSQEYQGGPIDLSTNLDQYLNLDNLSPEVVVDSTTTTAQVTSSDSIINVSSTKGFPKKYGLLKIDNEIITYTGITTNSFTGCIRGFSGITSYGTNFDKEEIVFSNTLSESHTLNSSIQNLSSLFLKEFYKKFKTTFSPGLENNNFVSDLNVGNFLKEIKSFYQSKGTNESFRILFEVLYGETPSVINLEEKLIKPSFAEYRRREIAVAKVISGEASFLEGQGLFKENSNIVASISEITPFKIDDELFYKLFLFVGYDEESDIQGRFLPTSNSKCTEDVQVNASIINVDSTIGFDTTGTIKSGSNVVTYTDKTVNQFLNCTGVTSVISQGDLVHDNEIYYGYENGDINKKVELVFFSTLSNLIQDGTVNVNEGDPIGIKNLGDKVNNPLQNKSPKQILANSWVYNTNSSYYIKNFDSATLELFSPVDKASLKVGDFVEIVERDTGKVVSNKDPYVDLNGQKIQGNTNITLSGGFSSSILNDDFDYNLRKILNKANIGEQSNVEFKYGNNSLISDIQNVYFDKEFAYVASNSLPSAGTRKGIVGFPFSEDINVKIKKLVIDLDDQTGGILTSFNEITGKFDSIKVLDNVGKSVFKTGDQIFYQPHGDVLVGLETGNYFVEVIPGSNDEIKLYGSNFLIGTENHLSLSGTGRHTITLESQKSGIVGAQKLLKKFPIEQKLVDGKKDKTVPGGIGLLINGVEITNYKSTDKVYYGPLKKINVLNGGENFDVINPPKISIGTGLGITALAQPTISGSIKDVLVDFDTYNFNIDKVVSIGVTGGNGKNCVVKPSITKTFRQVEFDARTTELGGGINTTTSQIVFDVEHGFVDGQEVIYDSNFGALVGINTVESGINTPSLVNKSTYVVDVTNNVSIKLHENIDDYKAGINTIVFTGGSGLQRIKVGPLNVLKDIVVVNGGEEYTNKKLIVNPSGISTEFNWINFENHGFNHGDFITYSVSSIDGSTTPETISGLSTDKQYKIFKIDNDKFRLCDAGIGGTITSNFDRKNYVKFNSNSGVGYQQFSYPEISVDFTFTTVGLGTTSTQSITLTPVVKGSIKSIELYEKGTGYGSSIINYENGPTVSILNGKNARVLPIVTNGRIDSVNVEYSGEDYYSVPDVVVTDTSKSGTGAVLRAIIKNNKLDSVKVIKSGIGYSSADTSVSIISSGFNQVLDTKVRDLTVITNERYDSNKLLIDNGDTLKYSVCGYDINTFSELDEEGNLVPDINSISGIIGWAYDGNPIYGPYGSKDPDEFVTADRLISGYVLDSDSVVDRPDGFDSGFFIEDYKFNNSGDLDEHNGRYEKNKEFPNGVYAYHAVVDAPLKNNAPLFPFFVGDTFRSKKIKDNFEFNFNQSYDFNNSKLQRNTFPYNSNEKYADNYFIKIKKNQKIEVDGVTTGGVDDISIVNGGTDFKVNDILTFDNSETGGGGLNVKVSSVGGENITKVNTIEEKYSNSVLIWGGNTVEVVLENEHDFENGDYLALSGISTDSLKHLEKYHRISIDNSSSARTISTVSSGTASTEIYVSFIPNYVSSGSTIGIGDEQLTVLNVFRDSNILRVQRGNPGLAHTETSQVNYRPKSFKIDREISYFDSNVNNRVYFNASESVGLGTEQSGFSTTFTFGNSTITREIPVKGIYLENHPFETNQLVKLTNVELEKFIRYSAEVDGNLENLSNGNYYVVNKSKNVIGIKTGIGDAFKEVYFRQFSSSGNTADNDGYFFEPLKSKITATVQSIETTVSVSTAHNLKKDDLVQLNIVPNLSVGIGTTASSVNVSLDSLTKNILINSLTFSSSDINTSENKIAIENHNLKTGDKVNYISSQVAPGLHTGGYFVFRVDDNNIKLGETYTDVTAINPTIVSINGTGGSSHSISLINPEIKVTKNNNLTFDLSDSSLTGYELNIYHLNDFNNEFVSTGITNTFSVTKFGTNGSTGAGLTLYSDNNTPVSLSYNIEKSGYISTSDTDVKNHSTIIFEKSKYNKKFKVAAGVGTTTFSVYLEDIPERFEYLPSDCETLEYSTTSKNAKGKINSLNIISSGSGYSKLPSFVGSSSTVAENSTITISSDTVGNINGIDIITDDFKYYTDNTLKPTSLLPSVLELKNSNTISSVEVSNAGEGYYNAPSLVIIDKVTREKLDTGFLEANFDTNITGVDILEQPFGLPDGGIDVKAVFNTNGFTIDSIESAVGTSVTCILVTPSSGFSTSPFRVGDEIYVEGIEKYSSHGSGHNSEDYGYRFFKITSIPDEETFTIVFDVSDVGLTTNTGIAVTTPAGNARVIPKKQYPTFEIVTKSSPFASGEKLVVNGVEKDLEVVRTDKSNLIVFGSDSETLKIGDIITGRGSQSKGLINKIKENKGTFDVDFSYKSNIGWENSIGKLSLDHQVIADNDYYQNLSYSVKSNQTWEEIKSPVGRLVHTSGLKNFSDTQIVSESATSIGSSESSISIQDTIDESRVDVLRGIDLARDDDSDGVTSNFLQFNKTRFIDFIDCRTNNVLPIDNINQQFSNLESSPDKFLNIDNLTNTEQYDNYLIRIESFNNTEKQLQLSEFVLLSNGVDRTLFNKSELTNSGIAFTTFAEDKFGDYFIETDLDQGFNYLRFVPKDPDNIDYDLKFIKTSTNSTNSGIGTTSIGFIDLVSSSKFATTGITTTIYSKNIDTIESAYITSKIINTSTKQMNYVETYITHDGTDAYFSEYYVDTAGESLDNRIGISTVTIQDNNLVFLYENDTSDSIKISSKIVGFGTTTIGNGEYRYLVPGQNLGDERTAKYEASFKVGIGTTTIFSGYPLTFDAVKCNVEVSAGSSKALHQITAMHDGTNAYLQQSQFLANNYDSVLGLGTFGATYTSSNFIVSFHPEDTTGVTTIKTFNQVFYKGIDDINVPPDLEYENIIESAEFKFYNAINGDRINRRQFDLKNNGVDIFKKTFNPSVAITSSIVDTGIAYSAFSIKNHFFRTGEELIYTPKSTFVGVGSTPMQYTIDGSTVGVLTSRVFAIRHDDDEFGIATTKAHSISGIGITVTSFGEGNAHEFEMVKSNEKALLAIDGIVQTPIANTNITHTVNNNPSPGISTVQTIFALSGISSVSIINILKVEDEYMRVENVGIGTSSIGPITPGIGTFSLVTVERGAVGSSATSHANGSLVELYKGNYNIVDSKLNFIEAPRGNPQGQDENGLPFSRSIFNGRVYLRNDYTSNFLYDDISDQFTGITSEFNLTVGGANTTGIGTSGGQGVLFINGIFQTPETDNNPQQNYQIIETSDATVTLSSNYALNVGVAITQFDNPSLIANVISGTSSGIVTFQIRRGSLNVGVGSTLFADNVDTGVHPTNVSLDNTTTLKFTGMYVNDVEKDFISESDVNVNQIPRGGLPITIGSTAGLGYAPLIGAQLRPVVVGGVITDVVGVATTGSSFGITTATYDKVSGILSVTTNNNHGLVFGDQSKDEVRLVGLEFACPPGSGITTTIYPENGPRNYQLVGVSSAQTFQVNVGTSTITHNYVGSGTVTQFFPDLSFGSGYNGIVSVAVTVTEPTTTVGLGTTTFSFTESETITQVDNPGVFGFVRFATTDSGIVTLRGVVGDFNTSGELQQAGIGIGRTPETLSISGHSGTNAIITGAPVGFNTHEFISADSGAITKVGTLTKVTPASGTNYNPQTGILSVTANGHPFVNGDLVTIDDESLVFSCAQDSFQTLHAYPRSTDYVSGISTEVTKIDNSKFTVFVGTSPAHGGGALEFNISNGGTGYIDPEIFVSEPSYENLSVIGISRRGIGPTNETGVGLKIDAKTTPSSDFTGIGSELFEVSEFNVSTPGYGFLPGDKFKPVGLVTSRFIESLVKEFELEVTEAFSDAFALWQFGEFDYIDSIKPLQNGKRTRFPLKYQNALISVEANENFDIELDPILLIFRNRVIQEPVKTYEFVGGTTVKFKVAPRPEDDIQIFFYKGTDGDDSSIIKAPPSPIEIGDQVKVISQPIQDNRLVSEFADSDSVRTNTYRGLGITDDFKSIEVVKQKDDLLIDGEIVSKSRELLESKIFPTAKIIYDFNSTDGQFFIDNAGLLFHYENDEDAYGLTIVPGESNPVESEVTATVSAAGTISGLTISNAGSGHITAPTIRIQAPPTQIGIGIGTTATATVTVSGGAINGFTITNPGFGYSETNPPQVIVSLPDIIRSETITGINSVRANNGVITGIGTTSINGDLAIKFTAVSIKEDFDTTNLFVTGNPVYVYDTQIGNGVTSIDGGDSQIVGIGTTFVDNVYIIHSFSFTGVAPNNVTGIITCKIDSGTDTTKIPETVGYSTDPIGKFSVGLLTGPIVTRSSEPLSIGVTGFTINSGLTTFPTIIRTAGEHTLSEFGPITE